MRDLKKILKAFREAEAEVSSLKQAAETARSRLDAASKKLAEANDERMRLATEAAKGLDVEADLQKAREAYLRAQAEVEELEAAVEHMEKSIEQAKRRLYVAEMRARKAVERYWQAARDEHLIGARKAAMKHLQQAMRCHFLASRMDPQYGDTSSPAAAMRFIGSRLGEAFDIDEIGPGADFSIPEDLFVEASKELGSSDRSRMSQDYDLNNQIAEA